MYEAMHTYSEFKPPNEEDQRLLRLYGKIPTRGDLLQHQLKISTRCNLFQPVWIPLIRLSTPGRKYFDSGDFALSQAYKSSSAGAVETGSEHPHREKISHPFSPVPSSSNVDEDANRQVQGKESTDEVSTGEVKRTSHLSGIVPENGNSNGGAWERKV
jgi:hypothetical protein